MECNKMAEAFPPPDERGGKPICSTYSRRATLLFYRFATFRSVATNFRPAHRLRSLMGGLSSVNKLIISKRSSPVSAQCQESPPA
jgi:hypothetical protein